MHVQIDIIHTEWPVTVTIIISIRRRRGGMWNFYLLRASWTQILSSLLTVLIRLITVLLLILPTFAIIIMVCVAVIISFARKHFFNSRLLLIRLIMMSCITITISAITISNSPTITGSIDIPITTCIVIVISSQPSLVSCRRCTCNIRLSIRSRSGVEVRVIARVPP